MRSGVFAFVASNNCGVILAKTGTTRHYPPGAPWVLT
jgi:hypothetical protein